MFREFALQILHWFHRHPGDAQLLSFLDGELSKKRRASAMKHLKNCDSCHARLAQIEKEWNYFGELNAASSAEPLFSKKDLILKIRSAISAGPEAPRLPASPGTAETDRRLAAVLGIYLGRRATAAILSEEPSSSSRRERLAGAEAALSTLLGRKGFAAVETRLLNIMNPKSAGGSFPS